MSARLTELDGACTGLAASWCPIHGDCTCPRTEYGDRPKMDAWDCPLHNDRSDHPHGRWSMDALDVLRAAQGVR